MFTGRRRRSNSSPIKELIEHRHACRLWQGNDQRLGEPDADGWYPVRYPQVSISLDNQATAAMDTYAYALAMLRSQREQGGAE